ncbi:MAG: class I SAM-dependent methyltransferase [Candidatus Vogelbacteria bacterium]|nr:class I SAM-dependent methyltransferase [Candidatus Vogelbacteria bacterium]
MQKDIFLSEGDKWFQRNRDVLVSNSKDEITEYLQSIGKDKKVLEIGCSNGWRLELIRKQSGAACFGVEPSSKAVQDAKKRYPKISVSRGQSHDKLKFKDEFFDVVIVSYVFHWVDRSDLLSTIAGIDRVLKPFGNLIIRDFDPGMRCKVRYHHLKHDEVYTYKQPYWNIFSESGIYSEIYSKEIDHEFKEVFDLNNKTRLVVLEKRGDSNYVEIGRKF